MLRLTISRSCAVALVLGVLQSGTALPATAGNAATTVSNAITTTDLNAVGMSPQALANALVGTSQGVSVVNGSAKFTGNKAAAGTLHITDPSIVSFNDGVVLSSGDIANVVGPNKSESTTGDMLQPGDTDLTNLIANTATVNPMTYDASVLEFDITANSSEVYFTYVFGSDEYLEWVNLYNDVFAFYIGGTNCATVSDPNSQSTTPVTIDTINSSVNKDSYRDNGFLSPPVSPLNIELDGISVELVCHATVTPGQPTHVKLAIADTSDQILDSVVILKSGTLSTTKPESCNNGINDNDDPAIDMEDVYCKNSTSTPLPSSGGLSGAGAASLPPGFTGNEGETIALDAAAIGWFPAAETVYTSWAVTPIGSTTGSCVITTTPYMQVLSDAKSSTGRRAATATAVCDRDGEYRAQVWGWTAVGQTSNDTGGTDIDFFVHNAPPTIGSDFTGTVDGATVSASATVFDAGVGDTVTCVYKWGDDSQSTGVFVGEICSASHVYAKNGDYIVTVLAKDNQGATAANALAVSINVIPTVPPSVQQQPLSVSVDALQPTSFTATADGLPAPNVQWQSKAGGGNWTDIAGATSTTYAIDSAALADDGKLFHAVFTNSAGSATSADAKLTVTNPVSVSGFAPSTGGGVGTSVTLTGTGFTAASTVSFNGKQAIVVYVSPTQLLTSVPTGATTGRISVATAGNSAASIANFTVATKAVLPTVTSFSPTSGTVGTSVTVTGKNLVGVTALKLGTITVPTRVVNSSTSLTFVVPAGAVTSRIAVTTDGGTSSSASSFTIVVPKTSTALTYTGVLTATRSTTFALKSVLTVSGSVTGLSGKKVSFTFNGKTYSATTDLSGTATVNVTAPKTGGSYPVAASFAGDTAYGVSSVSTVIVVK